MRIIFAGTPAFALSSLEALIDSAHDVVAVYTQPDRPAGRGRQPRASVIKQLAQTQNIPVLQPARLDDAAQQVLLNHNADVMIVVAYGLLLPQAVLEIPNLGCINVHASLLPRWRGAAPIARAILAGDMETGISIMQMDQGLDTGAVWQTAHCSINANDTSATLHDRLAQLGATTLLNTLANIQNHTPASQDDSQACYAHKLSKAEALLDWQLDASVLARQVRGFNPQPVAFTYNDEGTALRLWQAHANDHAHQQPPGTILCIDDEGMHVACGQGSLCVSEMQLAGGKRLPTRDICRAPRPWLQINKCLGQTT